MASYISYLILLGAHLLIGRSDNYGDILKCDVKIGKEQKTAVEKEHAAQVPPAGLAPGSA